MTTARRFRGQPRPLTIAHRGASGYLPEHSLPAKAMAHAMGADFLEQDLVVSADDQLVVLHDIHIDRVTDVAARYPARQRADGRFYARDFTLAELQTLALSERMDADGNPVFSTRYPAGPTTLRIPTFAEELAFIDGMNRSTGRTAGIYPEIKKPAWHREEGTDPASLLLGVLNDFGYDRRLDDVWVQCFDINENIRLKNELKAPYRLVQLIADDSWQEAPASFAPLLLPGGLTGLKGIVDGIGPWIEQLYHTGPDGQILGTHLIEEAHAMGMGVHPYTLRRDAVSPGFSDFGHLLGWLVEQGIDGIFTDFTDLAVAYFDQLSMAPARA